MTSIDDIIKREVNPFDSTNLKPGNFWQEKQSGRTVDSIHQEAIAEIESLLNLVAKDHRSRTILLYGDIGSGKSYLLGRLKRTLNPKAFFAYIGPWPDSGYIWRHTLRYTVDSLMNSPEGQQDSQLMLWLKSLAAFKKPTATQLIFEESIWNLLSSDRRKFINKLKATYRQARIYNPDIFFGVLHDLTNPELYDLACEWLRGDDLSEESLQELKVKRSIDTEDAAKNILANFGKISAETQPIVLCFDQLDSISRSPDGFIDLQALFNVNSTIHNDYLKNFLVIISIVTDTWNQNRNHVQPADQDRIDRKVLLKRINLDQAEALWAFRLQPLHNQANPQPDSHIYPLKRQVLEEKFPGGKIIPRYVLILGQHEYQRYKNEELGKPKEPNRKDPGENPPLSPQRDPQAEFQLIWQQEYKKVQGRITKIVLVAVPELIVMLQKALAALQIQEIKPKLLKGNFANYSLSYQQTGQQKRVGIVWTEDPSMNSFVHVMNACQKVVQQNLCKNLYLIRAAGVGNSKLVGNQIYRQIFTNSPHCHIKTTLSSVHYLATYYSLVKAAEGNELVVAGKTVNLKELESLIRDSKILEKCSLLQNLGLVSISRNGTKSNGVNEVVKEFLLNVVKIQSFLGRQALIQQTLSNFSEVNEPEINQLIEQLYQAKKISIVNPHEQPEAQSVCWVP